MECRWVAHLGCRGCAALQAGPTMVLGEVSTVLYQEGVHRWDRSWDFLQGGEALGATTQGPGGAPLPGREVQVPASLHYTVTSLLYYCRDLLLLASDSVRLESCLARDCTLNTATRLLRAVGCQTEEQSTVEREEEGELGQCTVQGCFCGAGGEDSVSWGWLALHGLSSLLVVLLLFTFGCGLELEEQQYFPATWHLLR